MRLIMDPRVYHADLVRLQLVELLFCEIGIHNRLGLLALGHAALGGLAEARYATETT